MTHILAYEEYVVALHGVKVVAGIEQAFPQLAGAHIPPRHITATRNYAQRKSEAHLPLFRQALLKRYHSATCA